MSTRHSVVVWEIDLRSPTPWEALLGVLGDAERGKAERFVFDRDRRRYVVAHAAVREILGGVLERAPGSVEFSLGEFGKPAVVGGGVEFSLSHSGERALVAVSRSGAVGVDIEQWRESVDVELVAGSVFSAVERRGLARVQGLRRRRLFFRTWVRKEAVIKATGEGLQRDLQSFDVAMDEGETGVVKLRERERWGVCDLMVEEGWSAAVAGGSALEVELRSFRPFRPRPRDGFYAVRADVPS